MKRSLSLFIGIMFAVSLIMLPLAGACAPKTQEQPVKIGALVSLTGGLSFAGDSLISGMEAKLDEVGWTVAGRPITIVYGDDATEDPVKALDSTKRMVEVDNVDIVMGPVVDGVFFAVQPYLEEMGVINLSHIYRGKAIEWEPGKPRWDLSIAVSGQMAYPTGTYAYEEMGIRTIATLGHDYETGYNVIGAFVEAFTKAGGTVVQQQWAPWGTVDFGPFLAPLKEADATVAWFVGDMLPLFVRHYHEFGYLKKQPLIIPADEDLHEEPQLAELGDLALGITMTKQYATRIDSPANRKFLATIEPKIGMLPNFWHSGGYEAITIYLAALEATGGDTDDVAVREALLNTTVEGPAGDIIFTDKGYALRDIYITEVQKIEGKLRFEVLKTIKNVPNPGVWEKP